MNQLGMLLFVGIDFRERRLVSDVQLAGAKGAFLPFKALDRVETNLLEPHLARVPVGRTFLDDQHVVDPPVGEHERAVAHEMLRPGPPVATLVDRPAALDHGDRHGKPGVMVQQ